ncbi:MAG: LysE family translocator [Hyphomonadaceae bacterium]|nr:LysE family translocator [Hyphomonadaceae bacterium]
MDASLLTWLALCLLVTITPGPDTLLVVGHAMRSLRAGLAATAGIASGFVWYAGLAGFGFMAVLAAIPALYVGVKIAGAAYLAWIGVGMLVKALWGAIRPKPDDADAPPTTFAALGGAPYRQGLLTNAFNPKIALFYLAALPQFVPAGPSAPAHAAALIGAHYLMGAVWLAGVAFAAARAGRAMKASPVMRWVEGAIGAMLLGLGVRLLLDRRV